MGKKTSRRASIPKRLNKPFDPRMLRIGVPGKTNVLTRGHIRHAPDNVPCFGRVGFLFNPSSITVQHTIDPTQVPDDVTGGKSASIGETLGPGVGIGNLSIPLLFDRTYEVWHRKPNYEPSQYGVYHDVSAFYHLIGLTSPNQSGVVEELVTGTRTTWASTYPIATPRPTFVYAQIGVTGNDAKGISSGLKYYGQITGLDVTYTHWSADMIPMRCSVNVGLMLMTDPNAGMKKIAKQKSHVGVNKPAQNLTQLLGGQ